MPDVREIVKRWLQEHGYDGLTNLCDCGCELDDLMPCSNDVSGCVPGHKVEGRDPDCPCAIWPDEEENDVL